MNYLAHAYLSFGNPEILTGNMISDFVKGKKKEDYSPAIQRGIELHRMIDNFTDDHSATREAKKIFSPHYRLYSGAFVDIVFDHFLANDKIHFTNAGLASFASETYKGLEEYAVVFPASFLYMFPYMKEHNWLYNYRFRWGIERSFQGLTHRAKYMSDSEPAARLLQTHYAELEAAYLSFFPELFEFARREFNRLTS